MDWSSSVQLSDNCIFDMANQTVLLGGKPIHLTDIQFNILLILLEHANSPVKHSNTASARREGSKIGNCASRIIGCDEEAVL